MEIRPTLANASLEAHAQDKLDAALVPKGLRAGEPVLPLYSNCVIKVTAEAGFAVMIARDGLDGEVRFQYPSEKVVEEYRVLVDAEKQVVPTQKETPAPETDREPPKSEKPEPAKPTKIVA